jgi:DNA-binding transcriptional MerR regulator
MAMTERPHLSISEVLTLLREEFPDITVSKIRFLESQGLIDPKRTPSGYRKFYDPDVERLRWILRQQREHYLPLKVIKGRLGQFEEAANGQTPEPVPPAAAAAPTRGSATEPAVSAAPSASTRPTGSPRPARREPSPRAAQLGRELVPDEGDDTPPLTGASLTRPELLRAAGLDEHQLAELESFGLLPPPRHIGQSVLYDETALEVARLARGFFGHGVEARHLKMYKAAAERESAFVAQVVAPLLKQRNPDARRQAHTTAAELARLGRALRTAMLRMTLPPSLGE